MDATSFLKQHLPRSSPPRFANNDPANPARLKRPPRMDTHEAWLRLYGVTPPSEHLRCLRDGNPDLFRLFSDVALQPGLPLEDGHDFAPRLFAGLAREAPQMEAAMRCTMDISRLLLDFGMIC